MTNEERAYLIGCCAGAAGAYLEVLIWLLYYLFIA